jgi:hypothetical protein
MLTSMTPVLQANRSNLDWYTLHSEVCSGFCVSKQLVRPRPLPPTCLTILFTNRPLTLTYLIILVTISVITLT